MPPTRVETLVSPQLQIQAIRESVGLSLSFSFRSVVGLVLTIAALTDGALQHPAGRSCGPHMPQLASTALVVGQVRVVDLFGVASLLFGFYFAEVGHERLARAATRAGWTTKSHVHLKSPTRSHSLRSSRRGPHHGVRRYAENLRLVPS